MEENRIPKTELYTNLETTRPRGRLRNRWQDEVMEDGKIAGEKEWLGKVYNREEVLGEKHYTVWVVDG
jgi:3'-phosphoadenosine 5'-phosphosulfate sulfotransferase